MWSIWVDSIASRIAEGMATQRALECQLEEAQRALKEVQRTAGPLRPAESRG